MRKNDALLRLRRAVDALESDRVDEALEEASKAVHADSSNADAWTLLGIVQSRLAEADVATESFRKALMLEPHRSRCAYNLAAHLFARGNYRLAWKAAREALKDNPKFEPAIQLIARIDQKEYEEPVLFILPQLLHEPMSERVLNQKSHVIAFMGGMEQSWTWIGWGFVLLGVVTSICVLVFQPIPPGMSLGKQVAPPLRTGPGPMITVFLMGLSAICSLMWMLVDVVDRQKKLLWVVPGIALSTCGFVSIPHALYMLMRKVD